MFVMTPATLEIQDYSRRMNQDARFAMSQMGKHFEGESGVFHALRRVNAKLKQLDVPYALVGGMALFAHGFRRTTDDVDFLVDADSLKTIHESLNGLGYVEPFPGSKQLKDVRDGVRIEFLITGGYPGDGKPKPVAFPDPRGETIEFDDVPVLKLERIIELKLASGMSNSNRLKDLSDVQELIRVLKLDEDYAQRLNAWVRPKFLELIPTD